MKEIIERMLKVEEEARSIQAEAEQRATEIAEEGRREADRRAEEIRVNAHAEASTELEASRRKLDEERRSRLDAVDRDNETYADKVRTRAGEAVDLVVRRVLDG